MSDEATRYTLSVGEADAGDRLDRFLRIRLAGLSRTRIQALIAAGQVSTAARTIGEPAYRVKPGDTLRVTVPAVVPAAPAGQAIALTILHEDDHLIVIDKPAGLVVHPAPGHPDGTLVNALIAHCGESLSGIGGIARPGIVHRLDKDTSGILVAAKNDAAHQGLARLFAAHDIERAYRAIVWGRPRPAAAPIDGAIGRDARNRKRMAVVARGGKPARTHYALERDLGIASLLRCRLESGRTHQIRVHLASRGHPVLGDPLYGGRRRSAKTWSEEVRAAVAAFPRQALHACELGFRHPLDGRALRFESPLPADMARLAAVLGAERRLEE